MTPFSNPIGRHTLPKRHPGSQQDSPRERTATGKQWELNARDGSQLAIIVVALQRIQNELGKLRRRVVGGGATQSVSGMVFKGEYDPATSYKTQELVAFTPTGGSAGLYIALMNVPAGTSPDIGAPSWFAFPAAPPGVFA